MKTFELQVDNALFTVSYDPAELKREMINTIEGNYGYEVEDDRIQNIEDLVDMSEDSHVCLHNNNPDPIVTSDFVIVKFEDLIKRLDAMVEDPEAFALECAKGIGKKKNGFFAKGRIHLPIIADGFGRIVEDCYGNYFPAIKAKSINDKEFKIFVDDHKEAW